MLKESKHSTGYIQIHLDGALKLKHRLITEQFIFNDDPQNKIQVDHINHIKADY